MLCFVDVGDRLHPYRIFFPSRYRHVQNKKALDYDPLPLVIACHPSNSDETQYFAWPFKEDRIQTIAKERGYVVVCPGAPGGNWHWGKADPTKKPEDIDTSTSPAKEQAAEIIMAIVREVGKQRHIDKTRIYLTGASSGAIASYDTAAKNPETFAAVAGVCGAFTDDMIEGLTKTPTMPFSAVKDKLFPIKLVQRQVKRLNDAGGDCTMHEVDKGHGGFRDLESYKVLFDYFEKHRRD